jgi:hypothetical protein
VQAFAGLMDLVRRDMYLAPHLRWYMREARLVGYQQFLESYKSVTLDSMAAAFDVSPAFLDQVRPGARAAGGQAGAAMCCAALRCAVLCCAVVQGVGHQRGRGGRWMEGRAAAGSIKV